jgi:hypothetical protein
MSKNIDQQTFSIFLALAADHFRDQDNQKPGRVFSLGGFMKGKRGPDIEEGLEMKDK